VNVIFPAIFFQELCPSDGASQRAAVVPAKAPGSARLSFSDKHFSLSWQVLRGLHSDSKKSVTLDAGISPFVAGSSGTCPPPDFIEKGLQSKNLNAMKFITRTL